MAKFDQDTLDRWKRMVDDYMEVHPSCPRHRNLITKGHEAWTLAHLSGVTSEAYQRDRSVTDGHIQTALEKVFPSAVFKDRKVY